MVARGWRVWIAVSAAALMVGCKTTRPTTTPTPYATRLPAATPTPAPSPAVRPTPLPAGVDAQAALLELEDRRSFSEPLLAGLAASPEASLRARTALALGRIGDLRGEAILAALLKDPAAEVRASAAFAAGIVPGGTLTADLAAHLSDPDAAVASAAAKAISFLGRPEGESALVAALPGVAAEVRPAVLRSLWKWGNEASEAAALPYASDRDLRVRASALYALARKPRAGSASVLIAALSDENADVAAAAARGLGVLGAAEYAEPLAKALDGRTPLAIQALFALDQVFEKSPTAVLSPERRERVLTLAGDANTNLAVPALQLLRRFPSDREASRRLWSLALTGQGRRRQVALQSLAVALKSGAESAISTAASSSDRFVRAAAADAAASLPASEARPFRERFAEDREVVVRLANVNALKTADAVRDHRPIVLAALADRDSGIRSAAVDALALLGGPSVLPLVADAEAKARADREPDVAISVIGACERLKDAPAAAALVEEIAKGDRVLPSRLARRSLLTVFGRTADAVPAAREYEPGRSHADYLAILADARRPWRAHVETTAGGFTIRFAGDAAPITVVNFLELARKGYFDGVVIHRVVPNFVLQDGDPTATGNGGPGYEIRDESNALEYGRGAVGMALSGPDTGGSQWFATHSPQPHLNAIYTIFGQVVDGQAALERIGQDEKIVKVRLTEAEAP
jgi:cyclophilin family peptidyl-prolyl cis-trans isomerase/HEAT repeat protein